MRFGLTALAATALIASPAAAGTFALGKPAPELRMTQVDGTKLDLADLRGQVVVLNLWATWCIPCRKELPLLDSFYRQAAKYGMRVFAITTEDSLPLYRLKPLFAAMAITPIRKVSGARIGTGSVPMNYIVDRAGVVRYMKAGSFDEADLKRLLVPLLNEPVPA